MKQNSIFKGTATALVTPFDTDGSIDYDSLKGLIEFQLANGIDALVICGTTGETPSLDEDEQKSVIDFAVKTVNGRVPVIAGTGGNNVEKALRMSKYACSRGVDGLLIVTPYYNKATQNGLVKTYWYLADNVDKPIIVYNVPTRTGVKALPETYKVLAKHKNIYAVKEADADVGAVAETVSLCGDSLDIYSGNDDRILPVLSLGGSGCISVISNILPRKTSMIYNRFAAGDIKGSAEIQNELIPLMKTMFCEVNPIPVKAALSEMGLCKNILRLPMTPLEEAHRNILIKQMKEQNLI